MEDRVEKLVIVGSGPAGLTAAIYASRGSLNPVVVSGRGAGGQLMLTTEVDDFPGFEGGLQGPQLMEQMRKQAERFATRFINEDVMAVDFKSRPFTIKTETKALKTQAVIIATGASAMWLGLSSEQRLIGRGVSSCAVCDGPFFKDKKVAVVGGGDAAMKDAQYLSKICSEVTIVVRRDVLKAQEALQEPLKSNPKVKFIFNTIVDELLGQDKVIGVRLKNTQTGEVKEMAIEGLFVAIGHQPNTNFLKGQLDLDEKGYVVVHDETQTSVEGVFVAGDAADYKYRQAVTAAGAGCKATLDVEEYLDNLK